MTEKQEVETEKVEKKKNLIKERERKREKSGWLHVRGNNETSRKTRSIARKVTIPPARKIPRSV